MLTPAQAISKLLENVRAEIIDDQQTKGIRASGKSAQSLKTKVREVSGVISGTLTGAGYFTFQEKGRRPGKMPPVQSIRDWIEAKGIQADNKESLAWAIAKKIAKEGSDIYQNKRPALATEQIIEIEIEKSRPEINKAIFDYFRTETTKVLKTAFR